MKQKKPLLFLLVFLFWAGYVVHSLTTYYSESAALLENETARRQEQVDYLLQGSVYFLAHEKLEPLVDRLKKARQLKLMDFYVLQKNDQAVDFDNQSRNLASVETVYKHIGQWMRGGDQGVLFKTIKVDDYKLTMGLNPLGSKFIFQEMEKIKWSFARDFAIVTVMLFGIAWYLLKDILQISKLITKGRRRFLGGVKSRSHEGDILLKAAVSLDQQVQHYQTKAKRLSEVVSSAIEHELKERTPHLTSFKAALVRVDLNGYTQLALEKSPEEITALLNHYFARADDIIQRYQGLVYQHVGDEIVFLIKDNPNFDSRVLAFHCVRSLFAEAERLENSPLSLGRPFRLKASICHGSLRFIRLEKGSVYQGLPLIESVRMLGSVQEKEESRLVIFRHDLDVLKEFGIPKDEISVTFKGFTRESHLCQLRKFHELPHFLHTESMRDRLVYFRGDQDLEALVKYAVDKIQENQSQGVEKILALLRSFRCLSGTETTLSHLKEALNICLRFERQELVSPVVFSAIVGLIPNLVSPSQFDSELQELLNLCLRSKDGRVQANALEILGLFLSDDKILEEYFESPYNRVAANALVAEGRKELTAKVRDQLLRLLQSQEPLFVASALWAVSTLAEHHYEQDPVFFNTNPDLRKLIEACQTFSSDSRQVVRKRALITLQRLKNLRMAA